MQDRVDIVDIMRALPHRYPFLLIDRVLEFEPDQRILALKNVTVNEPFFGGHFPENPIMPGVLILESMAQAAGMLAIKSEITRSREPGQKLYFTGIDATRFRRPVIPGDALHLDIRLIRRRRDIWRFDARALVEEQLCAESQITCAMISE